MLKNYFLTSLRNLKKEPGYAFLNIFGLTLGITSCLIIFLYIQYELNFDTYHEKADRIYRISSDIKEPDNAFRWSVTQLPLGKSVKMDYAEVEEYVRFIENGNSTVEYNNQNFFEEDYFFVDSTVFDVFSFEWILGESTEALHQPNSIVLSESSSKKIFGTEDPMGKQILLDDDETLQVTGVYKDMPRRSHLIANALISTSTLEASNSQNWGGFNIWTYVLLHPQSNYKEFEAKLSQTIEKHVDPIFEPLNIVIKYEVLPLLDIHLRSDFEGEPQPLGNIVYIYLFSAIGFFMLLIASINFINLSTARSSKRALEVGIRKVMGSLKKQLIGQFLTESLLYTALSLLLSFLLIMLLISPANSWLDLNLDYHMFTSPGFLLAIFGIILLVGILGGSYPAFFLSAFEPIAVLKGRYTKGSGKNPLRKFLVVIQFVISLFLLIGTGIIYDQLNYVRTKDLGFNKEHTLVIPFTHQSQLEKWPILEAKLDRNLQVISTATSTSFPGQGYGKNIMELELEDGSMDERGVDMYFSDFDYLETMGMEIVEGRSFSKEFSTDSSLAAIANEAMVRRMGWENPIGKKIRMGADVPDSIPFMKIIGVVKDYHHQSLYEPISALVILPRFNNGRGLIRIKGEEMQKTMGEIEAIWASTFPTSPFEYEFVDQSFYEQYEEDQRRGRIFLIFAVLTICIACLGLLGLASYTSVLRTKEISIRRVVGAGVNDILGLLTKDYLQLIAIAAIPGALLAWFTMKNWLEGFAYHTSMNYGLFAIAFIILAVLTLLTTGYFALKATRLNPADALKAE
ncbi:MAG: ABC transporter permease [Bacteroidota bacterium]